jgi:predicted ATPase
MLTKISVAGYKSLSRPESIDIDPLTVLAGANSAGKSSIMQPLLLLKQTLDASYDPGDLLLSGPNVRFTSAEQMLSRSSESDEQGLVIELFDGSGESIRDEFSYARGQGLRLTATTYTKGERVARLTPGMSREELLSNLPPGVEYVREVVQSHEGWRVVRNRCFFGVGLSGNGASSSDLTLGSERWVDDVRGVIHVPGLRGNPERTYGTTAVGRRFPGTFEQYVASIVARWQATKDERLKQLGASLRTLGLTWKVDARQVDDTQVELRVGRLARGRRGGSRDMVSIADVGFGVSQTLPVIVALLAAERGQVVYIEQPEIHLHPRAQMGLAELLAGAARRGVRVVVETHSALLLLGIQTAAAERQLISPRQVGLHWFERDDLGVTKVTSAELDDAGAFGDWPEDFGQTILASEDRYLSAAVPRIEKKR